MYAREVRHRDARGGYRFEILGDLEANAEDLCRLLRERIRQGLSVRHVHETEHGWQLTPAHRLRGVLEWDPETEGGSEQATAFLTVLEQYLALPFGATVLGETVVVEKIDLGGADELIAICRRRGKRQKVRLLDLEAFDRRGLVSLLGELYDAIVANRRFLHSRLTPGSRAIEEYRHLVADAI